MRYITLLFLVTIAFWAKAEEVTIRFKAPAEWTTVRLYTYSPELVGEWPGIQLTVKDGQGFFSFKYDNADIYGINLLFFNGDNEAHYSEFYHEGPSACYEPGSAFGGPVFKVNCPVADESIIIRYKAPQEWDRVRLYTYNPELAGEWPGILLNTKDDEGFYSYSYDSAISNINLIFFDEKDENQRSEFYHQGPGNCYEPFSGTGGEVRAVECPQPPTRIYPERPEGFISIYPNPTTDVINFITAGHVKRIMLFNGLGQTLEVIDNIVNTINISGYPTGLYYMTAYTTDGYHQSFKVIKR